MHWTLQAKGEISPVSFFQDWEPPAGTIAGIETSDQVKEIIKTILEKSREK